MKTKTKKHMSKTTAPVIDKEGKLIPQFKDVDIAREGTRIILPEAMSYAEGRLWLTRQEEAEEKKVTIHCQIDGFPLDGAVALQKAMTEVYGFTAMANTPSFFGSRPPLMVQIQMRDGTFITAPLGRMEPPMYEGGYLQTSCQNMALIVSGEVKRKHEPEVQRMLKIAKDYLKENSIYKGSAFILEYKYKTEERDFHPINDAPKFMDVSNVDDNGVILNEEILLEIQAAIYGRLEQKEAYEANGIPLKHTVLFAGKFGTGKTLTSRVIAAKAVRNQWTFIYLKTVDEFAAALKLAEMYAPAVLFTEDIDLVTSGERDVDMNEILNTLDGVDNKDNPIITILTTNKEDKIEKAMLRAGRVDTMIRFTYPNAKTAFRFVELYAKDDDGKSLLAPMTEEEELVVGESLAGKIPAFIAEAVYKAKCYAIGIHGRDISGKVTGETITQAAISQKSQLELLESGQSMTKEEKTHAAMRHIGQVIVAERAYMADATK